MTEAIYVVRGIVSSFLGVIELAMLLRVILSWFALEEDNKFMGFLMALTEPFVLPLRKLFDRMDWFTDSPLDIPFFLTYLFLSLLNLFV